jgi:hypothetical protein
MSAPTPKPYRAKIVNAAVRRIVKLSPTKTSKAFHDGILSRVMWQLYRYYRRNPYPAGGSKIFAFRAGYIFADRMISLRSLKNILSTKDLK